MTPDDKMIARMLQLPPDRNKLHNEQSPQSVTEHIAEYRIDNRNICDILDQISKDTDLIHVSNSISPRKAAKGHFMPSSAGGRAPIMSM